MQKILFLTPNLGSGGGGAERQIVTVALLMHEKGYNVGFLCYCEGNFYAPVLIERNIPIHWKVANNYLKRMFLVRQFIRNGNYDVVISFLETPNFLNNFSAIGGKSWKVITGERSAKESTFNSRRGKIFAWFQRYSDAIVCNSNNAKEMWMKYYPQYKNKLTTIYNTVTLPKITSEYIPKRDGKIHIIIAASYQYLKNPIGLIKALALLNNEEREKIRVDWYGRKEVTKGNTKAYDEAKNIINQINLNNIISLNEETKDVANKMNEADFVALFSSVEGLPNTICEGMTLGKPIIMTQVSDYKVLVDNSNGFLCDWNNIESIKNVLIDAITLNETRLIEMGRISNKKAISMFSSNVIVEKWINLISNESKN